MVQLSAVGPEPSAALENGSYVKVLSEVFGGSLRPLVDPESFRYSSGGDEHVSLRGSQASGRRAARIGPRRDHVVFWTADGQTEITDDTGTARIVGPGRPTVLSASMTYDFRTDATRTTLIHVEDAFLRSVAAEAGILLDPDVVFEQQDDLVARLAPLRTLVREAGSKILDPNVVGAERIDLDRRVAAVVLETFPVRSGTVVRHGLRDALAYIQEHAHDEVTLHDIARGAGVSARALQEQFRRVLDVTPMERLRNVRLEGVRAELVAPGPDTVVAEVAQRWRFAHLGRFSGAYRARYDELPSVTLRRARHGDAASR